MLSYMRTQQDKNSPGDDKMKTIIVIAFLLGALVLSLPWPMMGSNTEPKQVNQNIYTNHPARHNTPTVSRAAKRNIAIIYARLKVKQEGWGNQEWRALYKLWTRESNWNAESDNSQSTAYGIPQILDLKPGTPYGVQVDRGIKYIKSRYGTPSKALEFHYKNGWY